MRLTLDVRAGALAANALDGTLVVEEGVFSTRQMSIAQRTPTRFRFTNGSMQIEEFDWTMPEGTLKVSGRIGLEPQSDTELRLAGAEHSNVLYEVVCADGASLRLSCDPTGLCLKR